MDCVAFCILVNKTMYLNETNSTISIKEVSLDHANTMNKGQTHSKFDTNSTKVGVLNL